MPLSLWVEWTLMHRLGGGSGREASDRRSALGSGSKGFSPVEAFAYWTPRKWVRFIDVLGILFVCTCGRCSWGTDQWWWWCLAAAAVSTTIVMIVVGVIV